MNANDQRHAPIIVDVRWSIGKLLVCILAILFLLNMDELIEVIEHSTSDSRSHSSGLSYDGSIESGKANFFLLYEPSDVEIQVTPTYGDSDLYAVTNEDLDYFFDRFPHIREVLTPSVGTSQKMKPALLMLPHSFPWEGFSMPSAPETESKAEGGTVYWSSMPPFSYSSATLGVEKIHIPSANELTRPLLVCVFASPTGLNGDYFNYTLEMRNEKLHTSSYTTVRSAAERGTFSYEKLVRHFSTVPSEMDDDDWLKMVNGDPEVGGPSNESTTLFGSVITLAKSLHPILLSLFEVFLNVIV